MDRAQAALNPQAADKWVAEKVGDKLLEEESVVEEEVIVNKPRHAFLGMAQDLRDEYTGDVSRNNVRAKQIWESIE